MSCAPHNQTTFYSSDEIKPYRLFDPRYLYIQLDIMLSTYIKGGSGSRQYPATTNKELVWVLFPVVFCLIQLIYYYYLVLPLPLLLLLLLPTYCYHYTITLQQLLPTPLFLKSLGATSCNTHL